MAGSNHLRYIDEFFLHRRDSIDHLAVAVHFDALDGFDHLGDVVLDMMQRRVPCDYFKVVQLQFTPKLFLLGLLSITCPASRHSFQG